MWQVTIFRNGALVWTQRTQTSLRRNQDVLKRSRRLTTKPDVVMTSCRRSLFLYTTSWRRSIYVVLKTSDLRRLEDVWFTSSWRHPIYDVLKASYLRLEDVQFKTFWRRLIYVALNTSDLRRLEDVWFTTSWRCLIYDVWKTSVKRRLYSNVVATSLQRRKKWILVIIFRKF